MTEAKSLSAQRERVARQLTDRRIRAAYHKSKGKPFSDLAVLYRVESMLGKPWKFSSATSEDMKSLAAGEAYQALLDVHEAVQLELSSRVRVLATVAARVACVEAILDAACASVPLQLDEPARVLRALGETLVSAGGCGGYRSWYELSRKEEPSG